DDEIAFKGKLDGLVNLTEAKGIEVGGQESQWGLQSVRTEAAVLLEGMVGPDSTMAGKTLKELDLRRQFGVLVLAVHRQGKNLRSRFKDIRLTFGDTLLVQGSREKMRRLFLNR